MKMSLDFKREISRSDFHVGDFTIVPTRDLLIKSDEKFPLEPLVMDVFCILAERPGQVVMREELIDRLWHINDGGDENLTRAISVLRKTLREAGANSDYIETIPKRGYRLRQAVTDLKNNENLIWSL